MLKTIIAAVRKAWREIQELDAAISREDAAKSAPWLRLVNRDKGGTIAGGKPGEILQPGAGRVAGSLSKPMQPF